MADRSGAQEPDSKPVPVAMDGALRGAIAVYGVDTGAMNFAQRHSLSLISAGVVIGLLFCYSRSDPATRWGSFFGNAIADWTGVLVTVIATKHLYEKRARRKGEPREGIFDWLHDHKLTVFLLVTGVAWLVVYLQMDSEAKWGEVVGNLVSEWTQNLGFVLLTKKFIERSATKHHSP